MTEDWICARCGKGAFAHSKANSVCVWEPTPSPLPTDEDAREIFESIADRLGEHADARNYEIADSGEYETKLRGPIDVEVLAEWLMPTVLGFRRSVVSTPDCEREAALAALNKAVALDGTCSERERALHDAAVLARQALLPSDPVLSAVSAPLSEGGTYVARPQGQAIRESKAISGSTERIDALGYVEQAIYANGDSSPSVTWKNAEVLEMLGDIAELLTVEVPATPPTITDERWPAHWSIDDKLRDLHARFHCEDGNLLGKNDCAWDGCLFWEHASFALRAALGGEA